MYYDRVIHGVDYTSITYGITAAIVILCNTFVIRGITRITYYGT